MVITIVSQVVIEKAEKEVKAYLKHLEALHVGPGTIQDFLDGKTVTVIENNFDRQIKTTYQLSAPVDKEKLLGTIQK